MVGRSLAFTHTGFGRLLGHWLVRKQPDPDLAAALDETGHGNTAGFDLTVGNPARLRDFESEIPESQLAAPPSFSAHASALLLAVLNFLCHYPNFCPSPSSRPTSPLTTY